MGDVLFALRIVIRRFPGLRDGQSPRGIAMMKGRRRKGLQVAGGVLLGMLCVFAIVVRILGWEFVIWQWDLVRNYHFAFPAERVNGYEVTLMQRAGMDFYDSYYVIRNPDGSTSTFLVDGDDHKWSNPQTRVEGARIYYLTKAEEVTDRTSFIDRGRRLVYAGYTQRMLDLGSGDLGKQGAVPLTHAPTMRNFMDIPAK